MARRGWNKYGAKKTTVKGIKFDSKKEACRYADLQLLEKAGEISDLERQVPVYLEGKEGPLLTRTGRKMRMTVDFGYMDNRSKLYTYEDCKGYPTRDYEVRKAVLLAMGLHFIES